MSAGERAAGADGTRARSTCLWETPPRERPPDTAPSPHHRKPRAGHPPRLQMPERPGARGGSFLKPRRLSARRRRAEG